MDFILKAIDVILHLNVHLDALVADYGLWVYAILFVIVFCETGLVITPILPGDSLLFAAGAIAAGGRLDFWVLSGLMWVAAVGGDSLNYAIGRSSGRMLTARYPRIIKPQYMAKTHEFYERYGGKTIIIARFVPLVRTFAPFVAGIGEMTYRKFMSYNVIGATLWVGLLLPAGYFFANVPFVKKNFSAVILMIIFISILPAAWEFYKVYRRRKLAS